jgi:hypothetical protein
MYNRTIITTLFASKACNKLPPVLEEIVKNVYSYVSGSSKRSEQLRQIQNYFQERHLKMLKLSGTRWLATHQCVEWLLLNWDALVVYFNIAAFEDNLDSNRAILEQLQSVDYKCYFLFLKFVLN